MLIDTSFTYTALSEAAALLRALWAVGGAAARRRRSGNPRKGRAFPHGGRRSRWKMSKDQLPYGADKAVQ